VKKPIYRLSKQHFELARRHPERQRPNAEDRQSDGDRGEKSFHFIGSL
jgi:hypothetical protein